MMTTAFTWPKRRVRHSTKALAAALLATLSLASLGMPTRAHAQSNIRLTAGQTFDLSQATGATTIRIDAAGSYTLTGSSSRAIVDIQIPKGQAATVTLDEVTLAPSDDAPGKPGSARPAITASAVASDGVGIGGWRWLDGTRRAWLQPWTRASQPKLHIL